MASPRYRRLPHTADIRLAVWGRTAGELAGNAIAGALAIALGRPARGRPQRWTPIEPWPPSLERRLVRSVNEALYYLYTHREITVGIEVRRGSATLGLAPLARTHVIESEVKAATFHSLSPRRVAGRLRVVLILDL